MTVLGLPALLANMGRIEAQIVAAQAEGLAEAAEHIRDAWVGNIEAEGLVDTGAYRDSIKVAMDDGGAVVFTDVPYSPFLEYGTSDTPAHPVAERAFDEHADQATGIVGDRIRSVIR